MSYLSLAFKRIAEQNKRTQKEIADSAGLSTATLSRYFAGEIKDVDDKDFSAIAEACTPKKQERAELVAARCEDVRNGPGSDLVEIVVRGKSSERKGSDFPEVKLPLEIERAFAYLRSQVPELPELGDEMLSKAKGLHRAQTGDEF